MRWSQSCVIKQVVQPDCVLVLGYCSSFLLGRTRRSGSETSRPPPDSDGASSASMPNLLLLPTSSTMNSTFLGGSPSAAPS